MNTGNARAVLKGAGFDPSAHPTPDELSAYHECATTPELRERLAEHLAVCEDCTVLLLYGIIGVSPGEGNTEAIEAGREEVWNRIRPHLRNGSRRGTSLKQLLNHGPLPVEEALTKALAITEALAEMHDRGRVLNGLRTENVVFDSSGGVEILDLQVAHTLGRPENGCGEAPASAMSDEGYGHLSPEQIAREGLTERSNLFSLGVLFYEMLAGEKPFGDSIPLDTAGRIVSLDPPSLYELVPEIGQELSSLVDRLLAKKPEHRPPSAAAVARQLRRMLGGTGREIDIEDEIEQLYDRIEQLVHEERAAADLSHEREIEQAYERLLELQQAEAEQFRERFEKSLKMPIDAGEQILNRARDLRRELEDLAAANPAAEDAHRA